MCYSHLSIHVNAQKLYQYIHARLITMFTSEEKHKTRRGRGEGKH